jgi:hypothetical protein
MLADGRTQPQTPVYLPHKNLQNILRTLSPKNSNKELLKTSQQTPVYWITYLVDNLLFAHSNIFKDSSAIL